MNFSWVSSLYALLAAITWGAGDYNGGIASKLTNALSVVFTAHLTSLFLLLGALIFYPEPQLPIEGWLWGAAAGLFGAIGLIFLYTALASGRMALAAPVSAIIAASVPVVVTGLTSGLPDMPILFGFMAAVMAIWFLSVDKTNKFAITNLKLPILSGLSFGFFFLLLHRASPSSIIYPLIAVRITSILSIFIFSFFLGQKIIPPKISLIPILLSGIFDTIGNGAFALAAQYGRVDVAAVLSSLYPGSTVLLAWMISKEHIGRRQLVGVALSLCAIALITS